MRAFMCPNCGNGAFVIGLNEGRDVYTFCIVCDMKMKLDTE